MSQSLITAGQSLLDVALQELGSVEALFDLADANGLAITDELTPGQVLEVPTSLATQPSLVSYFQGRGQRINTGAPVAAPVAATPDFDLLDFSHANQDFS